MYTPSFSLDFTVKPAQEAIKLPCFFARLLEVDGLQSFDMPLL
jgi:hypothetical protein